MTWVGYRRKLAAACLSVFYLHLSVSARKHWRGIIMQLLFPLEPSILRQENMFVFKCVSHLEMLGHGILKPEGSAWIVLSRTCCVALGAGRRWLHPFREVFCVFSGDFLQDEMKFERLPRDIRSFLSGMNAVIVDLETLLGIVFNSNLEVFCLISSPDSIVTAARVEPGAVQTLLAVLWPGLQLPASAGLLKTPLFLRGCRPIADS